MAIFRGYRSVQRPISNSSITLLTKVKLENKGDEKCGKRGNKWGNRRGRSWGLEVKGIVDVLEFLGAEAKVAAGNHWGAMVENLGELDECHFAMLARRVDNLATKGLTEAVTAKVFDIKVISMLDAFKMAIYHLRRDYRSCVVEEAKFVVVLNIKGVITFADMSLKCAIYLDVAAFSGLLLDD